MVNNIGEIHWIILVLAAIGLSVAFATSICLIIIGIIATKEMLVVNRYSYKEKVHSTLTMVDRFFADNLIIVEIIKYIKLSIEDKDKESIIYFRERIEEINKQINKQN